MNPANEHRNGLLAATLAFVIWGLFPLYWRLLIEVPSFLIIAHRVIWSAVLRWASSGRAGVERA